jgi:hypothetical protein
MMVHELLRQAALILAAGWSKGADARDAAGRIVPLHVGANRSTINPEAVAFSPFGAICKAAADSRSALRASCSAGLAWRVAATSLVYIRASGGHR